MQRFKGVITAAPVRPVHSTYKIELGILGHARQLSFSSTGGSPVAFRVEGPFSTEAI